jgi:hypothetical protein
MTMIHGILEIISNDIIKNIPEIQKGIWLARIDDEGRVLIQSDPNTNEFKWAGITDNEGSYFYIRHRDSGEIFFEESVAKMPTSCGVSAHVVRYELRIVACMKNWCAYNLEERIRTALGKCFIPNLPDIKNIKIKPQRSQIDSIQVMKEESPKPKQFDKNLMFVAIDFDLLFEKNYF